MNFFDSINNAFVKCLDFKSRANRAEFWYFYLFTFLINTISINIDRVIGYQIIKIDEINNISMGPVYLFFSFLFFIPTFSLYVRRLHDTNRSGLWILIIFVPFIAAILGFGLSVVINLILVALITLVFLFCLKGNTGQNNFGSPSN